MKASLKQDVVVVNKVSGSGAVGMVEGLQAKPALTLVTLKVTSLPLLGGRNHLYREVDSKGDRSISYEIIKLER